MTEFLLPPDLNVAILLALLLASFMGSLLTAALGVGGGAFLLVVMAAWVPPLALIPLHGVVQLGSNANRAWLTRRHLRAAIAVPFAVGAILAALIAMIFLTKIETDWIPFCVALFILWLCWGPMPALGLVGHPALSGLGGFLTTGATMIFGATGPLVSAWLGRAFGDRWVYTASFSACMSVQHLLKVLVFVVAGFAFLPWIPALILMIASGWLGTIAGLRILHRLPEERFRRWFRWLLTLLALRLLWQGFWQGLG